jgi:hypothetical protein
MPLQRQNGVIQLLPTSDPVGASLDELLGPSDMRPGELCEPVHVSVGPCLRRAADELGISTSLAIALVAEHDLLLADVEAGSHAIAVLDARATARADLPLPPASADYARRLFAALNGSLGVGDADQIPPVIPARLMARVTAAGDVVLRGDCLHQALTWELAAIRAGRTMTEWALREVLAARC